MSEITEIEYDIYKALLLAHYINHWGKPKYSVKSKKEGSPAIYVYCFSRPYNNSKVVYFSTIGVALQKKPDNSFQGQEYFLVLPEEYFNTHKQEIFNYILDISVHRVLKSKKNIPPIIMESKLAPKEWLTRSILIDDPRGESEEFSENLLLGKNNPQILWIIPIYDEEYGLISKQGIEAFDKIEQESDYELIDVKRPSFLNII